ncbi:MAG TPA: phosphoribosylaminoimidazolesuccinocarboxamide synthase [Spirochaetota bacterium]|nr:phosphoribosylaminoimidazolesuccinocarboxamide synthase [Spirochaetota bacterium]
MEKLVYRGKSKDVYEIAEGKHAGKYRMVFTDRGTGYIQDGKVVFDPGYDVVVGEIPGKGAVACKFATHFFRLLKEKGIPSHFIDSPGDNEMIVEPAVPISMKEEAPEFAGSAPLVNLEFTWRNNGQGSFWRRYPFIRPCRKLDCLVEAWTKGDTDILITFESLEDAGVMTAKEIAQVKTLVKEIAAVVTEDAASRGVHVIDGKFELGRLKGGDGRIMLIDEISPDVLRVCRGYSPDADGNCIVHRECIQTKLDDGKRTIAAKNQLKASELQKIYMK